MNEPVVGEALDAVARGDERRLKLLLHPYLHWTTPSGVVIRGRNRVLDHLRDAAPAPPVSVELRDGQIYRWTEPGDV